MGSVYFLDSAFFVRELRFKEGCLEIDVGDNARLNGKLVFDYVRTFIFFKESDFWTEFSRYKLDKILGVIGGGDLGVFKILQNPLNELLLQGRLDRECPLYYWISTPDECLEVVAFEPPKFLHGSTETWLR